MVEITLKDLKVKFDDFVALHNINVDIKEGKITTLLGPSGCGKTTTLRTIAGFNIPVEGIVKFDDDVINNVPPQNRDSAFVFQNYALWPHMSVFDNIAYGLKLKKMDKEIIKEWVTNSAKMVNIEDQLDKKPSDLSGGQQQRVALARALVVKPQVLLCDEPLSNLDAKLRLEMRIQVRRIVNELGLTCVWVTHDQEEALSLSDEIVLMDKGVIKQFGAPFDVYNDPDKIFVAEFMGETSELKVKVIGPRTVRTSFGNKIELPLKTELKKGDQLSLVMRPEYITNVVTEDMVVFEGKYIAAAYMGKSTRLQLELEDKSLIHFDDKGKKGASLQGMKGKAGIHAENIFVFDKDGNRVK